MIERGHEVLGSLPLRDSKDLGSADFYFGINATFRFIRHKFGGEILRQYWEDMGRRYYAPVADLWAKGGLPAIAQYWSDFFTAEPGSRVEVSQSTTEVMLNVQICPAIAHLKAAGREIDSGFCQHCYYVTGAIGNLSGFEIRIEGGNGKCVQRICRAGHLAAPQDLSLIKACS